MQMTFEQVDHEENLNKVVWVPTSQVVANVLNPRKNEAIRANQMKEIIERRGWEEPLTAYKKGSVYVLLAGHRRLFAAKKAEVEKIPLFIVETPKSEQEEIDRIASLQSGRVDWSTYDWAQFVYQRWLAWKKPAYKMLAKELQLNPRAVQQYINVLSYYPIFEIEDHLLNGSISMSMLDDLYRWLRDLKRQKPLVVENLGEEMIRRFLMQKIIRKKLTRDQLRATYYIKMTRAEEIIEFITTPDATLDERLAYLMMEQRYNNARGHMVSIAAFKKRIPNIKVNNAADQQKIKNELNELKEMIEKQLQAIDKA